MTEQENSSDEAEDADDNFDIFFLTPAANTYDMATKVREANEALLSCQTPSTASIPASQPTNRKVTFREKNLVSYAEDYPDGAGTDELSMTDEDEELCWGQANSPEKASGGESGGGFEHALLESWSPFVQDDSKNQQSSSSRIRPKSASKVAYARRGDNDDGVEDTDEDNDLSQLSESADDEGITSDSQQDSISMDSPEAHRALPSAFMSSLDVIEISPSQLPLVPSPPQSPLCFEDSYIASPDNSSANSHTPEQPNAATQTSETSSMGEASSTNISTPNFGNSPKKELPSAILALNISSTSPQEQLSSTNTAVQTSGSNLVEQTPSTNNAVQTSGNIPVEQTPSTNTASQTFRTYPKQALPSDNLAFQTPRTSPQEQLTSTSSGMQNFSTLSIEKHPSINITTHTFRTLPKQEIPYANLAFQTSKATQEQLTSSNAGIQTFRTLSIEQPPSTNITTHSFRTSPKQQVPFSNLAFHTPRTSSQEQLTSHNAGIQTFRAFSPPNLAPPNFRTITKQPLAPANLPFQTYRSSPEEQLTFTSIGVQTSKIYSKEQPLSANLATQTSKTSSREQPSSSSLATNTSGTSSREQPLYANSREQPLSANSPTQSFRSLPQSFVKYPATSPPSSPTRYVYSNTGKNTVRNTSTSPIKNPPADPPVDPPVIASRNFSVNPAITLSRNTALDTYASVSKNHSANHSTYLVRNVQSHTTASSSRNISTNFSIGPYTGKNLPNPSTSLTRNIPANSFTSSSKNLPANPSTSLSRNFSTNPSTSGTRNFLADPSTDISKYQSADPQTSATRPFLANPSTDLSNYQTLSPSRMPSTIIPPKKLTDVRVPATKRRPKSHAASWTKRQLALSSKSNVSSQKSTSSTSKSDISTKNQTSPNTWRSPSSVRSCCSEPRRPPLPTYDGLHSEYGLSAEQLHERKKAGEARHNARMQRHQEHEAERVARRKMSESFYKEWLRGKNVQDTAVGTQDALPFSSDLPCPRDSQFGKTIVGKRRLEKWLETTEASYYRIAYRCYDSEPEPPEGERDIRDRIIRDRIVHIRWGCVVKPQHGDLNRWALPGIQENQVHKPASVEKNRGTPGGCHRGFGAWRSPAPSSCLSYLFRAHCALRGHGRGRRPPTRDEGHRSRATWRQRQLATCSASPVPYLYSPISACVPGCFSVITVARIQLFFIYSQCFFTCFNTNLYDVSC